MLNRKYCVFCSFDLLDILADWMAPFESCRRHAENMMFFTKCFTVSIFHQWMHDTHLILPLVISPYRLLMFTNARAEVVFLNQIN